MLRSFSVLALAGVLSVLASCVAAPADSVGYSPPDYYAPGFYSPGYYAPGYYAQPNVGIGIGFVFGGNHWHGNRGWRGGHRWHRGHGGWHGGRGGGNTWRGTGGRER